jgi:GMP synthase (glutamine-hydrolysing)
VADASLLVVQHEEACPAGWLGDWLVEAGCALDVRRPDLGEELPGDLAEHSGLLVMGGPMGARDDDVAPWLPATRGLILRAAETGVPALGVCLGHQLCAVALGGEIAVNPQGQQFGVLPIGWLPAADGDRLVGPVVGARIGVHWNNDVVTERPPGAELLARAPRGEVQAARFAPTVWGVQWHPEVDDAAVATWADEDRPSYPEGLVDERVAAIAAAVEELAASWRPLATSLARLARARP